ncbi:MAG: hypothetical protein GXP27_02425 [Planctomycetes bacterium]|nr:hypothetical protein [Planctomycetota bacterium]
MSQISSILNLTSSQLQAVLRIQQLTQAIAQNSQRLNTMKQINSAADDPSGLVHASLLQMELTAAETTSDGLAQANALLSTADSTANQILSNLQEARSLALEAAGGTLSASDVAANQVEIDSLLRAIDSLARTEFNGQRLLDGSSGFRVSGYDSSEILDVDVLDKQTADDVSVSINVTTQATQAHEEYNGGSLTQDTTVVVTGPDGTATVSLSSGATTDDIAEAFNAVTYLTGITATRVDSTTVEFDTVDYGSDATITMEVTQGSFSLDPTASSDGTDAVATINGQTVTADGTTFSYTSSQISLQIEVDPTASGSLTPFTVSGEGLEFVIGTSAANRARIGLPKLTTTSLGGITGKLSSVISGGSNTLTGGRAAEALKIIDDAIEDVTRAEAIIGSFQQYTIGAASNVMESVIENTSSALSAIQDADVALETALLTNNQLLLQTAYQALSITSLNSQNVLSLLTSLTS